MIPRDYITAWRNRAPWVQDFQVEQDLVISRALVDIFSHPLLAERLAFRGGTALYKLHLPEAVRYSEDIDLVQVNAEPAGPVMNALREALEPWLGKAQWKQTKGRVTFRFRFESEDAPPVPMRLKVEINSREHFSLFGLKQIPFEVASRWYAGNAGITTYEIAELLGTKLRALYQRRQGRDLFDLATALRETEVEPERIVQAFSEYMDREGQHITRALFEQNLHAKLHDRQFAADMTPLLATGYTWNIEEAAETVGSELIARLAGDPWKGEG